MTVVRISLIIPSVGRPESLVRALESVQKFGTQLSEVIVVHRSDDEATRMVADQFASKPVVVKLPGLAQAMRAGAVAAIGDVVAFMDDDAALTDDWYKEISVPYADPVVGGVGGVDIIDIPDQAGSDRRYDAGTVTRYGRVIGGHHLATGLPRAASHLKGVNCSFRRDLFLQNDFQNLLYGTGAQTRNEFVASMSVVSQGFSLILNPQAKVFHYPEARLGGDDRSVTPKKAYESAFNEQIGFRLYDSARSTSNWAFQILAGYVHAPGLLRLTRGAKLPSVVAVLKGSTRAKFGRLPKRLVKDE